MDVCLSLKNYWTDFIIVYRQIDTQGRFRCLRSRYVFGSEPGTSGAESLYII